MAITRTELHQAFRECISLEFVEVPNNENDIDITFSQEFLCKMEKLIANQKKSYWDFVNTAKKRVAVFAIIVTSLFVSLMSNEEVCAAIIEWCVEVFDGYNVYYFEGATTNRIVREYELTMVPDGFEVVRVDESDKWIDVIYENEEGNKIFFSQYATEDCDYSVDNENAKEQTIMIKGVEVKIYQYDDLIGAMWIKDGYYMSLTYYGCEDVKTIKDMVESVK